jgi:hypothetical protein
MFSVITNVHNKKTKRPTLMELFTATGKLKFFFDNSRFFICSPRVTRHTAIRYSSSCHTRVNMGASIFFTALMIRALSQQGHIGVSFACFALNVRCTVTTDLTRVIFQHTKRLLPLSSHFLTTYTRIA